MGSKEQKEIEIEIDSCSDKYDTPAYRGGINRTTSVNSKTKRSI